MAERMSESDYNSTSSSSEQHSEESGNELELNIGRARPYQDEPVANAEEVDNTDDEEDEEDEDGIPAATLEARYENRVSVDTW